MVRSDSSVAQLHEVLQVAFGWEDMHLHRFEIRGREYGVNRGGGVFFDTDVRKVLIGDLKLRRMERFTYEYDFGDSWIHDIRIEATTAIDPAKTYPICVAGKRSAPPEDCGGPYAFMQKRWQYELIGSGGPREQLEDLVDDVEDEEGWEINRRYHPAGLIDSRSIASLWRCQRHPEAPTMKLTIQLQLEGAAVLPLTVPIETIDRCCEDIDDIGLQIAEAKSILGKLQQVVVRQ
jgi:hypothetical protein